LKSHDTLQSVSVTEEQAGTEFQPRPTNYLCLDFYAWAGDDGV